MSSDLRLRRRNWWLVVADQTVEGGTRDQERLTNLLDAETSVGEQLSSEFHLFSGEFRRTPPLSPA